MTARLAHTQGARTGFAPPRVEYPIPFGDGGKALLGFSRRHRLQQTALWPDFRWCTGGSMCSAENAPLVLARWTLEHASSLCLARVGAD